MVTYIVRGVTIPQNLETVSSERERYIFWIKLIWRCELDFSSNHIIYSFTFDCRKWNQNHQNDRRFHFEALKKHSNFIYVTDDRVSSLPLAFAFNLFNEFKLDTSVLKQLYLESLTKTIRNHQQRIIFLIL